MDSPLFSRTQVTSIGSRLLETRPNAIISHRILRDILHQSNDNPDLLKTSNQILLHPWVGELAGVQHPDGSWGRFHSMDSTIKTRFPTTEIAIRRALALGLDKETFILVRAVEFMQKVLEGRTTWSDRVEKSEDWTIAVEAITAASLSQVDPANPAILPAWEYWVAIATRSFTGRLYDPRAEWNAHKDLRGLGIRYLGSRYVLTLLGARSFDLPGSLDRQLVDWVWNNPAGIGYLGADLRQPSDFHIFHWLESLEILSQFQSWRAIAGAALAWLWDQHNQIGLWDFGVKIAKSHYFPLSDDWRKAGNRCVDHSTRVLALLSSYDPGI
jgi:hypothetical protein